MNFLAHSYILCSYIYLKNTQETEYRPQSYVAEGQGLGEDLFSTICALVLSEVYVVYMHFLLQKHIYV